MTQNGLVLLAAGGSAVLLAGAFAFQAAGYAPCQLCLWQRWPHAVAVLLGLVALSGVSLALVAMAGALAALATAAIGVYHTGVERGWWEGPQACSAGRSLSELSGEDLLSTEGLSDVIRCDEVAWALGGLSMASWNALLSLGLAALWAAALFRRQAS